MAARTASTLDLLSGGRLLVSVVTGGNQTVLEVDDLFLDHAARHRQSAELLRLGREVILPGAMLSSIVVRLRFSLELTWVILSEAPTISAQSGIGYLTMDPREFRP